MQLKDIVIKHENLFNIISHQKDIIIFNENQLCINIGFVLEGEIKISNLINYKKEYTLLYVKQNGIFGDSLIFSDSNTYKGDIITLTNTKIAFINKQNFLLLLNDEEFKLFYLHYISTRYKNLQARFRILKENNLTSKLLRYLAENNNQISYKTKENLAEELNIPRPSLSRLLIKLEKENIILLSKNKITIQQKNL